jgi:hypothetical protein
MRKWKEKKKIKHELEHTKITDSTYFEKTLKKTMCFTSNTCKLITTFIQN